METSPPTRPPEPPRAALAIFDTQPPSHRISRRLLECGGRVFQVFFAEPRKAPPPAGFPVLTMLDGNAAFDALTANDLAAVPNLLVIGIGYDTPLRFHVAYRSLDYTPSPDGSGPVPDPARPNRMIGGADLFRELLCGDLRAGIEAGLAVDPRRRTLWGHSLAGQFVLHTLLARPDAFAGYVAVSPSLWWGDGFLLGLERKSLALDTASADILVMLGDSERRSSDLGPHWNGPAPATLDMIERLRAKPRLRVASNVFEGLGHAATLSVSLPATLAFAAGMSA